MNFRRLLIAGLLLVLPGAHAASADSFKVAIVVSATADAMADVLAGFRVATRENDGHANEESDGHLGGLDVYMVPVDAGADAAAVKVAAQATDIVLVIGADARGMALRDQLAAAGIPAMAPGSLPGDGAWLAAGSIYTPPVASFVERYEADYGRRPTLAAALGYNAARRIEQAVRPLGGVDDLRAVARALAASEAGFNW